MSGAKLKGRDVLSGLKYEEILAKHDSAKKKKKKEKHCSADAQRPAQWTNDPSCFIWECQQQHIRENQHKVTQT